MLTPLSRITRNSAKITRAPRKPHSSARMEKMKDRAGAFMNVEAGLATQGLFLQATSMGLGSTFVGGFTPRDAARAFSASSKASPVEYREDYGVLREGGDRRGRSSGGDGGACKLRNIFKARQGYP